MLHSVNRRSKEARLKHTVCSQEVYILLVRIWMPSPELQPMRVMRFLGDFLNSIDFVVFNSICPMKSNFQGVLYPQALD